MNNKLLYLIFLLLFPSCVEHIFLIKIEPNGNFNINYSANGDLKDLQNDDFSLPNSVDWKIEHQIQKKNDNYFFSSHKNFNLNDKIPDSFNINDSIPYSSLLKHPININKTNYIFFELFTFKCSFENRQVSKKYPKLQKWLLNTEDDPEGIVKEILKYIFTQTINDANLDFNIYPIVNNEFNNWIISNVNNIEDSIIFNNFDQYIIDGKKVIESNIMHNKTNLDSIIHIYKKEAEITINLIDDDFKFSLNIPNQIFSNNSDKVLNDILIWEFGLEEYLDKNKVLYAYSYRIIYLNTLIFLFLIIFILIYKKIVLID